MKPTRNARCVCLFARDFMIGLIVFFAVVALAMLDTRAAHAAPPPAGQAFDTAPVPARSLANEDLPAIPSISMEDAGDAQNGTARLAANKHQPGAGNVMLPGAADQTPAGRAAALTVMALIFAAMTALTLGLWRHLRHAVAPRRGRRNR